MLDFLKELQNAENSVKSDSTTEALQAVFKVLEQTKKHLRWYSFCYSYRRVYSTARIF